MLEKTVTYTGLDGSEITETLYFHLNKGELVELNLTQAGGLEEYLRRITQAEDGAAIMAFIKKILIMAYGKKSDDGKRFIKSDDLRRDFEDSEAYSEIIFGLVTDPDGAADFINAMIPKGLKEELEKLEASQTTKTGGTTENVFEKPEPKILTVSELKEMTEDQISAGLRDGRYKLPGAS